MFEPLANMAKCMDVFEPAECARRRSDIISQNIFAVRHSSEYLPVRDGSVQDCLNQGQRFGARDFVAWASRRHFFGLRILQICRRDAGATNSLASWHGA